MSDVFRTLDSRFLSPLQRFFVILERILQRSLDHFQCWRNFTATPTIQFSSHISNETFKWKTSRMPLSSLSRKAHSWKLPSNFLGGKFPCTEICIHGGIGRKFPCMSVWVNVCLCACAEISTGGGGKDNFSLQGNFLPTLLGVDFLARKFPCTEISICRGAGGCKEIFLWGNFLAIPLEGNFSPTPNLASVSQSQ